MIFKLTGCTLWGPVDTGVWVQTWESEIGLKFGWYINNIKLLNSPEIMASCLTCWAAVGNTGLS